MGYQTVALSRTAPRAFELDQFGGDDAKETAATMAAAAS